MPTLNIKDVEARELAQELAKHTGQTMTDAVKTALREMLTRERGADKARQGRTIRQVLERAKRLSELPLLDPRGPDEIIGYDENGIPR